MKVDNVKSLNTNSTLPNTKHISSDGATAATRPALNNNSPVQTRDNTAQIMQQHAQISRQQTGGVAVNPNMIFNLFKPRRLGDRRLSNADNRSDIPAPHPDTMEEVFGLLNGIKTSKQVTVFTKRLFKRIGRKHNFIDSNYEILDEDEKEELKDVKRKTTSKVTKEDVKNAIEEMMDNNPTNAYIIMEAAKRDLGLTGANAKDPKQYDDLDKAIIDFAKDNYNTHGVQIRAEFNIADEVNKSKNKTQFKELYYGLIQNPQLVQLIDIHKVFSKNNKDINTAHIEFMEATNLLAQAAEKDKDAQKRGRLPTSDPNTIHEAISVMSNRSKIDSCYYYTKKLLNDFRNYVSTLNGGKDENNKKIAGSLGDYLSNQRMHLKNKI